MCREAHPGAVDLLSRNFARSVGASQSSHGVMSIPCVKSSQATSTLENPRRLGKPLAPSLAAALVAAPIGCSF